MVARVANALGRENEINLLLQKIVSIGPFWFGSVDPPC